MSGGEWYAEPCHPLSVGAYKVRRALLGGLSQLELALRVGCSQAMISAIARGAKTPRTYDLVVAFEHELRISPGEWRTFDENRTAVVEPNGSVPIVKGNETPRSRVA